MLAPVGGEAEDPLGLDVESSGGGGFPEEQLQACVNPLASPCESVSHEKKPSVNSCTCRKCFPNLLERLDLRDLTLPTFYWSTTTIQHLMI